MNLREARKIYDIYDVLSLDRRKTKYICPLPGHIHRNNTPSFVIFIGSDGVQRFQCLGNCGLRGDVIDLVGYLNILGYNDKDLGSVRAAAGMLGGLAPISVPEPLRRTPRLSPIAHKEHPIGEAARAYALKRGLTEETIQRFLLGELPGQKTYLAVPIFEEGVLQAIKYRNIGQGEPRFFSAKGSIKAMFNYDAVCWASGPVVIVKGEIPAMLLSQHGFMACAPSGGEAALTEDRYRGVLSFASKRVLIGDNDRDPGVRERMQAKASERARALHAELRFPPQQYKDVDEWILAEDEALSTIRSWME
jgi:hypothetical protein